MDDNDRISDLTVQELKALIRATVQEAVAEVIIEFSLASRYEAEVMYQAEMADLLRESIEEHLREHPLAKELRKKFDD